MRALWLGGAGRFCALCAAAVALMHLMGIVAAAQDGFPAYSVLYSFPQGLAAGGYPEAGLIADVDGNLYGTTNLGGNTSSSSCRQGSVGCGVVFMLDPQGQEKVLYAFSGGSDGSEPNSGLTRDATGNLYGTTPVGGNTGSMCPLGSYGCGVIFELNPSGTQTVLHTFIGPEGAEPTGALVLDGNRSLYGATFSGGPVGAPCPYDNSCGVVFKLDLNKHSYRAVHFFSGGDDGGNPASGLIRDADGNLYGTTESGGTGGGRSCHFGSFGCGVVFEMDPSGNETQLYNFTGAPTDTSPQGHCCGTRPAASMAPPSPGATRATKVSARRLGAAELYSR
jgi:uncharacterized repeat protein (TIGR03803 family)